MTEAAGEIDPLRAELPAFSVDWRFLLPVRAQARILILTETGDDFSDHFAGLGIEVVSTHLPGVQSRGDAPMGEHEAVESGRRLVTHPADEPLEAASFDAVVLPFGLPEALSGSSPGSDPLSGLRRLLRSGGVLLLGFSNRWGLLGRGQRAGIPMSPASMRRRLRAAGFGGFREYGAAPNLERPAYIMPLKNPPLQFFLRHRLLGRSVGPLLRLLPAPLIGRLLPALLPCYFVVAWE